MLVKPNGLWVSKNEQTLTLILLQRIFITAGLGIPLYTLVTPKCRQIDTDPL